MSHSEPRNSYGIASRAMRCALFSSASTRGPRAASSGTMEPARTDGADHARHPPNPLLSNEDRQAEFPVRASFMSSRTLSSTTQNNARFRARPQLDQASPLGRKILADNPSAAGEHRSCWRCGKRETKPGPVSSGSAADSPPPARVQDPAKKKHWLATGEPLSKTGNQRTKQLSHESSWTRHHFPERNQLSARLHTTARTSRDLPVKQPATEAGPAVRFESAHQRSDGQSRCRWVGPVHFRRDRPR